MQKIYFLKNFNNLQNATEQLLNQYYDPAHKILVKLHFGEPGNTRAFMPDDISPIISSLKNLNLSPLMIDTPVMYESPRDSIEGYSKVVKDKGFDKLADFVISNTGINIEMKDFTAEICKEVIEAKNFLMISHVKGHGLSGFGGAIKNFGMGCVTKNTKKIIHELGKPKFISDCQGCGVCAKYCPCEAITMFNGKAMFNLEECFGCSICQEKCPNKCLTPQKNYFDDLLAQGAAAAINNLKGKAFYINIIKNITRECDCWSNPGEIVAGDIGILFSDNPVAIDKASIDLINIAAEKNVFYEIHHKDPLKHVTLATDYIGQSTEYELIEI